MPKIPKPPRPNPYPLCNWCSCSPCASFCKKPNKHTLTPIDIPEAEIPDNAVAEGDDPCSEQ